MRRASPERWVRAVLRWRQVPWGARWDSVAILGLLSCAEGALRVLPLRRVCRTFGVCWGVAPGPAAAVNPDRLAPDVAERVESACSRVDRVLRVARPRDACLRRALVLGHLLRDLQPTLRIGVVRGKGPFGAHAWLEVDGVPLPEPSGGGIPGGVVPLRKI